jgi:hypothetical protein
MVGGQSLHRQWTLLVSVCGLIYATGFRQLGRTRRTKPMQAHRDEPPKEDRKPVAESVGEASDTNETRHKRVIAALEKLRGSAASGMSTEQIMAVTRDR